VRNPLALAVFRRDDTGLLVTNATRRAVSLVHRPVGPRC
jgi:hypothetical protein